MLKKVDRNFEKILFSGPEGKHSIPFGQVLIDGFIFNGVGFMIEQRLIWIAG